VSGFELKGNSMASKEELRQMVLQELALANAVQQVGLRAWEAPSPRHAAAWLRLYVDMPSSQLPGEPVPGNTIVQPGVRTFYRGQSDTTWMPTPTLFRIPPEDRPLAARATKVMASVVDCIYSDAWKAPGAVNWARNPVSVHLFARNPVSVHLFGQE